MMALTICLCLCSGCGTSTSSSSGSNGESTQQTVAKGGDSNAVEIAHRDETLVVAQYADPTNLDPHNNQMPQCFTVEEVLYDRLVEKDAETGEIVPSLATSWEQIDELTWRFYLRDDVYFHNGEQMTAEDVRYTIKRSTEMMGSKVMMESFDGEGTEVVDDFTIDIK